MGKNKTLYQVHCLNHFDLCHRWLQVHLVQKELSVLNIWSTKLNTTYKFFSCGSEDSTQGLCVLGKRSTPGLYSQPKAWILNRVKAMKKISAVDKFVCMCMGGY